MRARLALICACLLTALLCGPPSASGAFGLKPGAEGFDVAVASEGGVPASKAGSHPVALTTTLNFNTDGAFSDGDVRDLSIEFPPGLIENPTAVSECSQAAFHTPRNSPFEASRSGESCPDTSQIGIVTIDSSQAGGEQRTFGLFNLAPPPGAPSQLGANPYGSPITFVPAVRQADGEYGLTLQAKNLPQLFDLKGMTLTVWGTPWSVLHNAQRGDCLNELEPAFGWSKCSVGQPKFNVPVAHLTLPTSCEGPMAFTATASSWQGSETVTRTIQGPTLEACDELQFNPKPFAQASDPRASSPSGYEFNIDVDTSGVTDPGRSAPSVVRKAVVTLPEGMSINPSVGAGLGVCHPGQYAAETVSSLPGAGCPNQSKIGDFRVNSPLFDEAVEGGLFLAAPFDNPFDSLIAIYLVAKAPGRGILVKVAGKLDADPDTGRLTATFDNLPQLPYSRLSVHFREGQRSPLATPGACGTYATRIDLTPWRDPNRVASFSSPLPITSGVGGGPCPSGTPPFSPRARGGMLNSNAGSYTPFHLRLTRQDQEQEITSYSAQLPPGLLGRIAGIPYCPEAAIAAAAKRSGVQERDHPSCPSSSLIGHTVAGYGLGPVLTYAPGGLYLAGPYKGSSFSVVAIDSALVGPFDLGVVIVRSAIKVDPQSAQVSIDSKGSDPIPHIIDGIPIHLRDVRVYIDKPKLTLNPTSCAPSTLASALNGSGDRFSDPSDDTLATATAPFQAFNCASLAFRPKLSLKLKGGTTRGKHPALRVEVRPRPGDANIAGAQVTLPPSLFLDQSNITTICTGAQFARRACPKGSVYGKATAYTPLLDEPLSGPVYLRSSEHTLPDLVFSLEGRGIRIELAGRIDSGRGGGLRGTFEQIPDAPVSKFVLRMNGGKRGVLVNAANLCTSQQLATARFIAHNDRGVLWKPEVRAGCGKGKGRKQGKAKKGRGGR